MSEQATIRRNRLMLIVLFAITFVPLIGAFWLYESSRTAQPWGTTNHGELLNPIVTVADLKIIAADGTESMADGKWWLVVVEAQGCPPECRSAVHELHQVHVLLGRDAPRVRRAVITLGDASVDRSIQRDYPEVVAFKAPASALRPGIYIVDPLGNVVLRYDYRDADKPVLEDMKKLLKVSHIG